MMEGLCRSLASSKKGDTSGECENRGYRKGRTDPVEEGPLLQQILMLMSGLRERSAQEKIIDGNKSEIGVWDNANGQGSATKEEVASESLGEDTSSNTTSGSDKKESNLANLQDRIGKLEVMKRF